MATTRSGAAAPQGKDITDALRGSVMLIAIFGVFIGLLATPIYLVGSFIAGLGVPVWPTVLVCIGVAGAELYGLVLILRYLSRRDEA